MRIATITTHENGDRYKTISYDADGRATSSGLSDGLANPFIFNKGSSPVSDTNLGNDKPHGRATDTGLSSYVFSLLQVPFASPLH